MAQVPINSCVLNDAVMFTAPEDVEDVYVLTVVDVSKSIFTATRVSNKSVFNFSPVDMVTKIDVPGIGLQLLSL